MKRMMFLLIAILLPTATLADDAYTQGQEIDLRGQIMCDSREHVEAVLYANVELGIAAGADELDLLGGATGEHGLPLCMSYAKDAPTPRMYAVGAAGLVPDVRTGESGARKVVFILQVIDLEGGYYYVTSDKPFSASESPKYYPTRILVTDEGYDI